MKLGLLAIFRNESHVLKEWLDHYIEQGIDHFYLINNSSTDNFEDIISAYDNITLKYEGFVGPTEVLSTGGRQVDAYNEYLPEIDCDWLYICDVDEFAYGRNGHTIKSFLLENHTKFDQYLIPLKTFNSNGQISQPESVVKGFTKRWSVDGFCLFKPLVKVSSINKISINYCTLKSGLTAKGDFSIIKDSFVCNQRRVDKEIELEFRNTSNNLFNNSYLVSNHYTVQSKEWFFNVKATRGTATWHGGGKMPALEWFTHIWNRIESRPSIDDFELVNQKQR